MFLKDALLLHICWNLNQFWLVVAINDPIFGVELRLRFWPNKVQFNLYKRPKDEVLAVIKEESLVNANSVLILNFRPDKLAVLGYSADADIAATHPCNAYDEDIFYHIRKIHRWE